VDLSVLFVMKEKMRDSSGARSELVHYEEQERIPLNFKNDTEIEGIELCVIYFNPTWELFSTPFPRVI